MDKYDFKGPNGELPSEIFIFGDTISNEAQALIVNKDAVLPKDISPVLYITKVVITDLKWDDKDPNADGVWGKITKSDSKEALTILSNFEIPDGVFKCKIPECVPECLYATIEHFNDLLLAKKVLHLDFIKVYTENGKRMVEADHYYHDTGELTPGDGKPFRRTDIRNASVSMEEYIQHIGDTDWWDMLLEQSKQYCIELSPIEFVGSVKEDMKNAVPLMSDITLETPDGLYY